MKHPVEELRAGYERDMAALRVIDHAGVDGTARRLVSLARTGRYDELHAKTGVPIVWTAASFEREASSRFELSPAQGDRWDHVSTHVPKGRGPFSSWAAAGIDAYHLNGLDKIGAANWTWVLALYYGELFNGFGYRDYHRMRSPYLVGGTNLQQLGKYTSDGKFDPVHMDKQIGIVPVMMTMAQLEPELAIPGPWPFALGAIEKPATLVPAQSPLAAFDIFAVQRALKTAGFDPGYVDGSFGRKTSAALRGFEQAHGLTADGLLDKATADLLLAA